MGMFAGQTFIPTRLGVLDVENLWERFGNYPSIMDNSPVIKADLIKYIQFLLKRFPKGFAVSPEGQIYETVSARKRAQDLPALREAGGYLAVVVPEIRLGDELFGLSTDTLEMSIDRVVAELNALIDRANTNEEDEVVMYIYEKYREKL